MAIQAGASCNHHKFTIWRSHSIEMVKFLSFEWLLKLIYILAKCSGYVFIAIEFPSKKNSTMSYKPQNLVASVISFAFSFWISLNVGHLPVSAITHSQLTEIGINLITRLFVLAPLLIKFPHAAQRRHFFTIISNFHSCHVQVSSESKI
jgi:hypothetical protein